MLRGVLCLLIVPSLLLACAGTGSGGDGDGDGRVGPIDFMQFVQDRPAVGGDWYLYDEAGGHTITPFEHVYLVRQDGDPQRFGAVRIVSYYDPDLAESGRFTVAMASWDDMANTWSTPVEVVTSKNVKSEGAVCLDVLNARERACDESWQVQLRAYPFLAREGPITVTRPGLFVREAGGNVNVATLDGRTSLDDLPNPENVSTLDDGASTDWSSSQWDIAQYAPDLPVAGMAIGPRWLDDGAVGRDDVYALVDSRRSVTRFSLKPITDGNLDDGIAVEAFATELDLADNTIDGTVEDPTVTELPALAVGETGFLSFYEDDLIGDGGWNVTWPDDAVPAETGWQLAFTRTADDVIVVRTSPAAAVYNRIQIVGGAPEAIADLTFPIAEDD